MAARSRKPTAADAGPFDESNFVTTEIHAREVKLADGKAHTLHFRELPNTDLTRYAMWQTSGDEDVRAAAQARLVSLGLCSPEGDQVLTLEQAVKLKLRVLRRLVDTLLDVNGYTGLEEDAAAGKHSGGPKVSDGSGTS